MRSSQRASSENARTMLARSTHISRCRIDEGSIERFALTVCSVEQNPRKFLRLMCFRMCTFTNPPFARVIERAITRFSFVCEVGIA
jgi:hypothetical protein